MPQSGILSNQKYGATILELCAALRTEEQRALIEPVVAFKRTWIDSSAILGYGPHRSALND